VDVRVLNTPNTYRHLCYSRSKLARIKPRQTEPEHHKVNPPYEKKKQTIDAVARIV
jgi:hypothetical protein